MTNQAVASPRDRYAVVAMLAEKLREKGSWCGETHLQKAGFFLSKEDKNVFPYKYILYKHGPYSFEFSSVLAEMQASRFLDLEFKREGYGPSYVLTQLGKNLLEKQKDSLGKAGSIVERLADFIDNRDVKSLEQISTALFVIDATGYSPEGVDQPQISRWADEIVSIKPHINFDTARHAVKDVLEHWLVQADNHAHA